MSKSLNTLQRVSSEAAEISENVMKYNELLEFIRETSKEEQIDERLLSHMARCCEGLTLSNDRKRENWVQCLEPYLSKVESEMKEKMVETIYVKGIENLTLEKVNPEDEEEYLCNAQFSLAYGTRVLFIKHHSC